jgi:CHAT domain-containing protein
VLHLATHGFFLGGRCASTLDDPPAPPATSGRITRENPLLLSGLILAGANHRNLAPPDQEDGVLTAEEIAALNLRGVDWAVLSGCDTGIGELKAGEGVFGLRRAFQLAGARTVIMSLWPVEDEATRRWMAALYRGRFFDKLSTASAVRQASLEMLRQRRAQGRGGHPFHWGAFVAAGDWR